MFQRLRFGFRRLTFLVLASVVAGGGAALAEFGGSSPSLPPPTGLTVSATPTSLTLNWQPVPFATGYGVYLDSQPAGGTVTTSWTFGNLQCGTSHKLEVDARRGRVAVGQGGDHGFDERLSFKRPSCKHVAAHDHRNTTAGTGPHRRNRRLDGDATDLLRLPMVPLQRKRGQLQRDLRGHWAQLCPELARRGSDDSTNGDRKEQRCLDVGTV